MIEINSVKLIIEYCDSETGEIFTREATLGNFKEPAKKASTPRAKKVKDDGEEEPMIHVIEGKLQFNNKAIELTGFQADDRVLIQFEKKGKTTSPVVCLDDKGNRMTKTSTVSFKGQQREHLLEYGTDFKLEAYEGRDGMFKMLGGIDKEDDIVEVPEFEEESSPISLDNLDFSFD